MGNNCVHGKIDDHGALYGLFWPSSKPREDDASVTQKPIKIETETVTATTTTPPSPKKVTIDVKQTEEKVFMIVTEKPKPRKNPNAVNKRKMSIGLEVDSVLKTKTGHLKQRFDLGEKLGHGQFGTTFLCTERKTGSKFACKSIAKRKLVQKEDLEDVRREVEILHHLSGHDNVVSIQGAYEDAVAVHVVMELCAGGELFDRIVQRGHYSEKKAAELTRTIVGVLEACHSLGVMHRDVKPENFLFVNGAEDSAMKIIDFGLSVFFKPGIYTQILHWFWEEKFWIG